MAIGYNRLLKLLFDKNIKRTEHGKICAAHEFDISDIVEMNGENKVKGYQT